MKSSFFKKLMFLIPPETAHNLAIFMLKYRLVTPEKKFQSDFLYNKICNIEFPNPVGISAGFDKNAEAISSLYKQNFGFLELGTVTPEPQKGNKKPRLFRLEEDQAIINSMGFNNRGYLKFIQNIMKFYNNNPEKLNSKILGTNIGANKTSSDYIQDYLFLIEKLYDVGSYTTINISSPNTPNLRKLQKEKAIHDLLSSVAEKQQKLEKIYKRKKPVFLKIASDTSYEEKKIIVNAVNLYKTDGMIVGNTVTGMRNNLKSKNIITTGGLSGKPICNIAKKALEEVYTLSEGKFPIIASGGIFSAEDAYERIKSGASLIQIYTALIYKGFKIVNDINAQLVDFLKKDGFSNINEAIGKNI